MTMRRTLDKATTVIVAVADAALILLAAYVVVMTGGFIIWSIASTVWFQTFAAAMIAWVFLGVVISRAFPGELGENAIGAMAFPVLGLLVHGYQGAGTLVGLGLMWLLAFGVATKLREWSRSR